MWQIKEHVLSRSDETYEQWSERVKKMTPLQIAQDSLEKWKVVHAYLRCKDALVVPPARGSTCALCEVYFSYHPTYCVHCPLALMTGVGDCLNTPWKAYASACCDNKIPAARLAASRFVTLLTRLVKKLTAEEGAKHVEN